MPIGDARSGILYLRAQISKSGTGQQNLVTVPADRTLVLLSLFGICNADSLGTYGVIETVNAARKISEFVALKGSVQILQDPSAPAIRSDKPGANLVLNVEAIEAATNGFADIKAWVWGTYELEG